MAARNNNSNPRNQQSNLYRKLTRLFSGPIINYRRQFVRKDRRVRLDKYASRFRSASGQQFKKKSYNPYDNLLTNVVVNQNRAERYADFDQMEFMPELASALDIYADEISTHSEFGQLLKVDCKNEELKEILNTLFYEVLNVEFNLYGWARTMVKYGDLFLYLDIDEQIGVKSIIGLPNKEVERLEGEDPTNPNYVQFQWNSGGMTLENWQVAHFRVLGNDKYSPYGTSVLDPARRIWRQLTLLEDAMMSYRIVRAPDRRVFYIDVGGVPPEDVEQYMQKVMTQMKRHQVVDANTGQVDLRYNPASIEEDFYVPIRGAAGGTKIENLQGTSWANDIDDVKYLRDKLFAAVKIPMSYLIRGEGGEEDKTTLAQKDIRFARTIQRLQRSVISELEKVAVVHLYTLGYRGEDLTGFKLYLHNPSKIAQLQDLEQWRTKLELSEAAVARFFSNRWIAKNILDISDEEHIRNQRERFHDKKLEASMAKIAEVAGEAAGAAEMGAMGAMPELGAEMGEEMGMPEEGMAAPEEGLGAPAEAPAEEPTLLATPPEAGPPPPGKRDEEGSWYWKRVKKNPIGLPDQTTTAASKGKWYTPVTTDKRDMGARKKNMLAKAGPTQFGRRATHKGYHELDNLRSLSKGIVSEEGANYNSELIETTLFHTSQEVKNLIEGLEKNSNETET